MDNLNKLRQYYERHKREMEEFLKRCADMGRSNDAKELFKLLCLNLLKSQAKWEEAKKAVEYLDKTNCLFSGDSSSILDGLRKCGYRSQNNKRKAEWLYEVRQRFYNKDCQMDIVNFVRMLGDKCAKDPCMERNRLAGLISGLGMTHASHFLRGLGFSHNQLAILDSVVLGQLEYFGVIKEKPKDLPKKMYLDIERQVKDWADNILGIPLDGLDWLLWRIGRGSGHVC